MDHERGTGDGGFVNNCSISSDTAGIIQLFLESTNLWYERVEQAAAIGDRVECRLNRLEAKLDKVLELLEPGPAVSLALDAAGPIEEQPLKKT